MPVTQFRLRSLLLFTTAVAVATWVGVRWVDARNVLDMSRDRSSVCELHNVRMSPKVVPLGFGMRMDMVIDRVRPSLFPHAEEPHDSRSCLPPRQQSARVYVCPLCTRARDVWLDSAGNGAFVIVP